MKSGATCIAYETVTSRVGRLAAAQADERSRRADVDPGRRPLSRKGTRRPRRPARRRPGRGPGQGRDPRRRRRRRQRRANGGRHARRRHHLRHQQRPAGRARHVLRRARSRPPIASRAAIASAVDEGRAGDRRGAGARRRGAQAGHPRHAQDDEARQSCWSTSRSTRAAASKPAIATTHDDPVYRGRRRHPLLRRQHARRGRADQRLRAQQCDPAVRAEARQPRRRSGDGGGPAPRRRAQRVGRQDPPPGGRRSARPAVFDAAA